MYEEQESIFYYLTVGNENYTMPAMGKDREAIKNGILKGMYKFRPSTKKKAKLQAQLFGSGAIMSQVLQAQEYLEEKYDIAADVWSITSYKELRRDALNVERWNMLHPNEEPKVPYITQCLADAPGVFVAASDYMKALPDSIVRWSPKPIYSLGTDGFGRSESRVALRDFFEVDYRYVSLATLASLVKDKKINLDVVNAAMEDLEINPAKLNPMTS
jgi:pyruvate dehydrogenase E1 component